MKINISMKSPDAIWDQVTEAVKESLNDMPLLDEEKEVVLESRMENTWKKLEKWIEYKEYIEVEFDLEKMTAIVKQK